MSTIYPNREHQTADAAAMRRALKALDTIESEAAMLRRKLNVSGRETLADGDDTQRIAATVRDLTQNLSVLGALREVREWHAADVVEAGARKGGQ